MEAKEGWFVVTLKHFYENIFEIITIFISAGLIFYHRFKAFQGSDIPMLITWVLSVLALLAASNYRDRRGALRRIENKLRDVEHSSQPRACDFFCEDYFDRCDIARANQIDIMGIGLEGFLRVFTNELKERIREGSNIRIILVYPNKPIIDELTKKYSIPLQSQWTSLITSSINKVKLLANVHEKKGTLSLGLLPYTPSFGIILLDRHTPYAECRVKIFHHDPALRDTSEEINNQNIKMIPVLLRKKNPSFVLRRNNDSEWFNHFAEQYEIAWNSCLTNGKVLTL